MLNQILKLFANFIKNILYALQTIIYSFFIIKYNGGEKVKKYMLFLLVLLVSLTCVTAANETSQDISDAPQEDIQASQTDTANVDTKVTHQVNTSENLHEVVSDLNTIQSSQSHVIELEDNLMIDDEIDNEYLTLTINGNNHQLTVNKLIFSNAVSVTLNNMTLELNSHINNMVDLYLNNVTIKSTNLYDNITKTLADNGIEEYTEDNFDKIYDIFAGSNTNHGNIHNYKNLYVNNSLFTKTIAHTGSAIYNHGYLNVDNTVFSDTLSSFGVVYSEGSLSITNSIFASNKQCGYLLHSNSGEMSCINNSFIDNYALYNTCISNVGTALVEGCNFTNNKASSTNSIDNDGNMTVKLCTFKDNKGEVIRNTGNLTLSDSIIEDNDNELNIITNNYIYDGETGEILRIGNMTLINNRFTNNTCDKLIYNGASITLLNNSISNVSNLLDYAEPGDYILDEVMDDVDTTQFNRSVTIESNTFIIDTDGVIDELMITNQTNYVQHTPKESVILLDSIGNVTVGDNVIISGILVDNDNKVITGDININISDYAYSVESTDDDGYFSYECTPAVGTYNVVVSYNQNRYIKASNVTATFTVNEKESESDVNETEDSDSNITDVNSTDGDTQNDTEDSNKTDVNDTDVDEDNGSDSSNQTVVDDKNMTDTDVGENNSTDVVDGNATDVSGDINNTDVTDDNENTTDDSDYESNIDDNESGNTDESTSDNAIDDSDKNDNGSAAVSSNQNTTVLGNIKNNNKATENTQKSQKRVDKLLNMRNKIEKRVNNDLMQVTSASTEFEENNAENEENTTTADDNTNDNKTTVDTNNKSNNQSNNVIPIAAAIIAVIAIIGVVIIKK